MSLAARVGRAIFWGQAGRLAEAVLLFLFSLLLARLLGPASYGLFALGISIAGLCGFLVLLGLGPETLGRFLPEVVAGGRRDRARGLLARLAAIRGAAVVFLACVAFYFRAALAARLHFPAETISIALVLLVFASRSMFDLLTYFSSGLLEIRRVAIAKLTAAMIAPILIVFAWSYRATSTEAAWLALAAGYLIGGSVLAIPFVSIRTLSNRTDAFPVGRILAFGMFTWVTIFFVYILGDNADVLLLGWLLPDRAAIGYYAVGAKIAFSLNALLLGWVSFVSVASFSEAWQQGGGTRLAGFLEGQWKLGVLSLVGPSLLLIRYAREIVKILYSAAYAPSVPVIQILCGLMALSVIAGFSLVTSALYATSHERLACTLVGGAAAFNIGAEIVLVRRIGILGAAWATGLSFVLLALSSGAAGRRFIPWHFPGLFTGKVIAASALAMAPTFWIHPDSGASLAAGFAMWSVAFLGSLAILKPLEEKDSTALVMISPRLGRWATFFGPRNLGTAVRLPTPGRITRSAETFPQRTKTQERNVVEMEERLISIAIPTYNRGALLEEALASILPQMRSDVEVVVYDTGSPDDTCRRMEKLAQDNSALRFFSTAERYSLDETLLRLLDVCRGEYVWFFSSDDQMKPGTIEAVRERILSARERPALVYVNQEIVDEAGKTLVASQVGAEGNHDFRDGRKILPRLGLNLGFISASVFRRQSGLHASGSSAHEFLGTRSLNLHLYLRCLLEGGSALYIGEPHIRARRASGAPPYEYADVFVRDIVRILEDARARGFGRFAIYHAMHRIVAGQYLRLVLSWRAGDPVELARTFPIMAKACWKYPAFWVLLLPIRFAPPGILRSGRNRLRRRRDAKNHLGHYPRMEKSNRVSGATGDRAIGLGGAFGALVRTRKWIAASGSDLRFKAIPFLVTTYRGLYARLRPKETITIAFRGHLLQLDLTDVVVARSLVTSGEWEQYETLIFSKTVEEGMVVVDIGANIGHYTLEAARRVGKTGKVFAFEPEPHNFSLLCRNIEANGYQNVVPVQMALSNRTGAARLTLSPDNLGGHHFENSIQNGKAVTVGVTTLDEYLRHECRRIDVIKMDAEGAEMGILEGMKGILAANPDLILFTEFYPEAMRASGHEPEDFLTTLMESGFSVGILDQSRARIEPLPEVPLSNFIRALLENERGKSCVDLLCVRGKGLREQLGLEDWRRDAALAPAASAQ